MTNELCLSGHSKYTCASHESLELVATLYCLRDGDARTGCLGKKGIFCTCVELHSLSFMSVVLCGNLMGVW